MKLLYDTGVTPLINKHYGYTFQPGRYGQVAMRAQPESRTRYPRQFTRMQHQAQTRRAWAGLSAGEISNWDTFAATYPQACKNPDSGYLTGYQNFLKRQYYQFLNYSPAGDIITSPGLTEIFIDPCTYEIRYTGGELFIDYEFTNWLNDNIVSLYCSYPKSPGRLYQKTQSRYMGFITNLLSELIKYGKLYNWYCIVNSSSITSSDDWVIPSRSQFSILRNFVVWNNSGALKETGFTYWDSPNSGATNQYLFNSRGAGYRPGSFLSLKQLHRFWTSTPSVFSFAGTGVELQYNSTIIGLNNYSKYWGLSIRLLYVGSGTPSSYTGNDGQIYNVTLINGQYWLSENLNETQFRNGSLIPEVTDNSTWSGLTSPAFCFYDNDPSNGSSAPTPPLSLNITELYKYNFGLIPEPGKHLLFKAVPMAIENGQFFEKTLDLYAIV